MMNNAVRNNANPIDNLAFVLKNTIMPSFQREALENQLSKLILGALHLSSFDGSASTNNVLLQDMPGYGKMSDLVFAEAYNYALATYGKLDQVSGETIPFMKLFFFAWGLKHNKLVLEKIKEKDYMNQLAREAQMRELFSAVRKRTGFSKERGKINVLNIKNVRTELQEMSASSNELDKAESIMDNNYVCSDTAVNNEGENLAGMVSDRQAFIEADYAERAAMQIVDALERVLQYADSKTVRKYILYHFTFLAREQDLHPMTKLYLRPYIDADLVKFVGDVEESLDNTTLLAEYLGLERETVRKNLRKAELAFINSRKEMAS